MSLIGLDPRVVLDTGQVMSRVATELFSVKISPEEIAEGGVLVSSQHKQLATSVYEGPEYLAETSLMPGTIEGVRSLSELGHEAKIFAPTNTRGVQNIEQRLNDLGLKLEVFGIGFGRTLRQVMQNCHAYLGHYLPDLKDLTNVRSHLFFLSSNRLHLRADMPITPVPSWREFLRRLKRRR